MIEVHLYGKLRRFTDNLDPSRDLITYIATRKGDSIAGDNGPTLFKWRSVVIYDCASLCLNPRYLFS